MARLDGRRLRLSVLLLVVAGTASAGDDAGRPPYRSPFDLAFSPDGAALAVSDWTAGRLVLLAVPSGASCGSEDAALIEPPHEIELRGAPAGVAWAPDGGRVFVAEYGAGTVAEVTPTGHVARRLRVGPRPVGIAVAPRSGILLAANSGDASVSLVELRGGKEAARVRVEREPWFIAVAPDESLAVVGNRLPAGDASSFSVSAAVSLIDLPSGRVTHRRLPPNSLNVLGIAISPDGRWAHVLHNLGRTNMSTERVTGGWISRNALTLIDLRRRRRFLTVALDSLSEGAANPWDAAISQEGGNLWVTLSGTHQLARLDLASFWESLRVHGPRWSGPRAGAGVEGEIERARDSEAAGGAESRRGHGAAGDLDEGIDDYGASATYDLGLFLEGRFLRFDLPGSGPRGLALSPDGKMLAVALYFSGQVLLVDAVTGKISQAIPLGTQPEADLARRGEEIFHDATRCYQHWLSCATCHPDARADGLNWDLFNDGAGNPKNTRSLLLSHRTPPAMSRGARPDMESAVEAGFDSLLFRKAPESDRRAVEAYLRSLEPAESPFRIGGRLSEEAERGAVVFASPETGCAECHPAPLFTDLALHDVGTRGVFPWEDRFDTPTLIEVWRTAPYLHHGKARTLRDVLTEFNREDRHGKTSHLSGEDLEALVRYLESL